MESQSYFKCGRRALQFYSEVVVIVFFSFECAQSDWSRKHKNVSRQMYSFLEVKLRQSDWKSWTKINMIFVQPTVLANSSNLNGWVWRISMQMSNIFARNILIFIPGEPILRTFWTLWSDLQLTVETMHTYNPLEYYNAVKRLHSTYNFHFS